DTLHVSLPNHTLPHARNQVNTLIVPDPSPSSDSPRLESSPHSLPIWSGRDTMAGAGVNPATALQDLSVADEEPLRPAASERIQRGVARRAPSLDQSGSTPRSGRVVALGLARRSSPGCHLRAGPAPSGSLLPSSHRSKA